MKILWTKHAVEDLVNSPEQIVPGDMDALVAQKRVRNGLLRTPFIEMGESRKILTVYWTSKVERYWKEEV